MSASRSTTMEINASSLRQARGSPLSPPPAAGHESDDAPSAGRSDPPPTSSLDLPRTAEARGLGANHDRGKVELRDLLGEQVEVGYEALRLVLDYLYSGRVAALPKAACLCVDEDACPHVGCRPAVAFMAQVVFAASTFDVAELTNLFQVLWENSGHDLSAL